MKKAAFHTLGCKVNQYETEAIKAMFEMAEYEIVDFNESADVYIINTCTVTNVGDKKSRQAIRQAYKKNPSAIIVVAGCLVQVKEKEIEAMEEVNILAGTSDKSKILTMVENYQKESGVQKKITNLKDVNEYEALSIQGYEDRTRAYIKIQDGCRQFCTYCIIPYARGELKSRPLIAIKEETEILANKGYQEIVLTGIHLASYGKDIQYIHSLLDVVKAIHIIPQIKRIRFGSLEPNLINKDFMETLSSLPKVCNHFHLSLQSGSNHILQKMNRKYTRENYQEKVVLIKQYLPEASITTDIIVGFPGETEEDFQESLEFIKQIGFYQVHVFPYSKKEGTPAAKMKDQLSKKIKTHRVQEMLEVIEQSRISYMTQFVGKTLTVLTEEWIDGNYIGHTNNFLQVKFPWIPDQLNQIVSVKIHGMKMDSLYGEVLI